MLGKGTASDALNLVKTAHFERELRGDLAAIAIR
jgi:hypothetical protein